MKMMKILLIAALAQPIVSIKRRGILPRRRVFQRKPKQTYKQRWANWHARYSPQDAFDLNHAA